MQFGRTRRDQSNDTETVCSDIARVKLRALLNSILETNILVKPEFVFTVPNSQTRYVKSKK